MDQPPAVIHKDAIIENLAQSIDLLQKCKIEEDAKNAMDIGAAAKVWAERQKLGIAAQNSATEFVLHAERILGKILSERKKHRGGRPGVKLVESERRVSKLKELGISRDLSSTSQRLAAVPEKEFATKIADAKKKGLISHTSIVRQLTRKRTSGIDTVPQAAATIEDAVIVPETPSQEVPDRANPIISSICTYINKKLAFEGTDVRRTVAKGLHKYLFEMCHKD